MKNNDAVVIGTITKDLELSHEISGEKFYECQVSVTRQSGTVDCIPMIVPERVRGMNLVREGARLEIKGTYRSKVNVTLNRHISYIFPESIETSEDDDMNEFCAEGYICKTPVYRTTPSGRKITDVTIAINHKGKRSSDYIPLVVWERNAEYIKCFEKGTRIKVKGRIQSRIYKKEMDGVLEERETYEVSVREIYVLPSEVTKK